MSQQTSVGFIGLGLMGSRMAMRLTEHGYPLTVYNRTREKATPLAERGARVADSPRACAADSEIVVLSLANDAAVEDILLRGGVIEALQPGAILIDCSTISPDTSRRMAQAVEAAGATMLDAPVSGSTPQAESGALTILVGGPEAGLERCRPLLDVLGQRVIYMGPNGSGTTMKLVVNALLGVAIQVLGEALALGEKAGLARDRMIEVLNELPVLSGSQKGKMQNARRDAYPVAFPVELMAKDFALVADLASRLFVPMPATAAAREMTVAEAAKGVEEDFSAVIRLMQEMAGVRE